MIGLDRVKTWFRGCRFTQVTAAAAAAAAGDLNSREKYVMETTMLRLQGVTTLHMSLNRVYGKMHHLWPRSRRLEWIRERRVSTREDPALWERASDAQMDRAVFAT